MQLEFSTSRLNMAAVDDNQGEYLAINRSFFSIFIGFDNILPHNNKTTKTEQILFNVNINNDDVMMTKLTILENDRSIRQS